MLQKFKQWCKQHPPVYRTLVFLYGTPIKCAHFVRRLTHQGGLNYYLCMISSRLKLGRSMGKPILLTIEPINSCNLKCTICETGQGILERPFGKMSLDQFKSILDQFDHHLEWLALYFMGETFMNKEAYEMIRYAYDRGIKVSICTNGDLVDPERLIRSGVYEIKFQLSGMTNEAHAIYRQGSNLERVQSKLEQALQLRDQGLALHPDMTIRSGFIAMKHNEHQIDDFIKYVTGIGVDGYNIIPSCVRKVEQAYDLLPQNPDLRIYDDAKLSQGKLVPKKRMNNRCDYIYGAVTVQVNGDVVPCCRDVHGRIVLGNLFQQSIQDIWNNDKYTRLRKAVSTQSAKMDLCRLCSGYDIPKPEETMV